MRGDLFYTDVYAHVYNRGTDKRTIFQDEKDRQRFIRVLTECRFSIEAKNLKDPAFILVEIAAFCLMDNHYHLLLRQKSEQGISKFMQRLGNSYTKYFNVKHDRKGRLFESSYKAQIIEREDYLHGVISYIHKNPLKLPCVSNDLEKLANYQWSSLQHYTKQRHIPFIKGIPTSLQHLMF